jgi:hypothetical protein
MCCSMDRVFLYGRDHVETGLFEAQAHPARA